jgi:hypothetical protein
MTVPRSNSSSEQQPVHQIISVVGRGCVSAGQAPAGVGRQAAVRRPMPEPGAGGVASHSCGMGAVAVHSGMQRRLARRGEVRSRSTTAGRAQISGVKGLG